MPKANAERYREVFEGIVAGAFSPDAVRILRPIIGDGAHLVVGRDYTYDCIGPYSCRIRDDTGYPVDLRPYEFGGQWVFVGYGPAMATEKSDLETAVERVVMEKQRKINIAKEAGRMVCAAMLWTFIVYLFMAFVAMDLEIIIYSGIRAAVAISFAVGCVAYLIVTGCRLFKLLHSDT